MYQTLDNVDGKQARRTGTSSPLGELFDHGIDSLNCIFAGILQTAALGLGSTNKGVITTLSPCLAFFFSTWETYHTHTLFLGFINGPVEGILLACGMMLVSGIWGPQVWTQPLYRAFPGLYSLIGDSSFADIWTVLLVVSIVVCHIPFCLANVAKARRAKGLSVRPLLLDWVSMVVFTVATSAWAFSPHTTMLKEHHFILFCTAVSLVFGRLMTKIILSHLLRQPFPGGSVMLVPLVLGAFIVNLPALGRAPLSASAELFLLWAFLLASTVMYFYWALTIIRAICLYLDINALTIRHRASDVENGLPKRG